MHAQAESFGEPIERLALSPGEAFETLSVSRNLGYRLLRTGQLKSVRISPRKIVVPLTAIEAFLRGQK
ncbi:MAG: helix-turn-helix domain-containing protein [Patescibacteria group bacterium]|nr:helix-turn-helix domain-containing protein [Patescibacteria group bacterium]